MKHYHETLLNHIVSHPKPYVKPCELHIKVYTTIYHEIFASEVSIGRKDSCRIKVDGKTISAVQCEVRSVRSSQRGRWDGLGAPMVFVALKIIKNTVFFW